MALSDRVDAVYVKYVWRVQNRNERLVVNGAFKSVSEVCVSFVQANRMENSVCVLQMLTPVCLSILQVHL